MNVWHGGAEDLYDLYDEELLYEMGLFYITVGTIQ